MFSRMLVMVAGLALVVFGLQGIVLGVVGRSVTATVLDVERRAGSEAMDYEYTIRYRFRMADGRVVNGNDTLSRVYNTATLPAEGSTLAVKYLAAWPAVNAPARATGFTLARIGVAALGFVIIVAGRPVRSPRRGAQTGA